MCKSCGGWSGTGWQDWCWLLLFLVVTREAFDCCVFLRICPARGDAADTAWPTSVA